MAKIIKFNIVIDGQRCRSVEDIQQNFNILDMLDELANGRLYKWAKSRKFVELSEQLKGLQDETDNNVLASKICELFDIKFDQAELQNELILKEISEDLKQKKNDRDVAKAYKLKLDEDRAFSENNVSDDLLELMDHIVNLDTLKGYKRDDYGETRGLEAKINDVYIYLAEHNKAPASVLDKLVTKEDCNVNVALINNANTPESILKELINYTSYPQVKVALAASPNTPVSILEILAADYDDYYTQRYVASNPNTPESVLEQLLKDSDYYLKLAIAGNPSVTVSIFNELASYDDLFGDVAMAASRDTTTEILTELAYHDESYVRKTVASNLNTPVKVLCNLADDDDNDVKVAVALNPNIPMSLLEKLDEEIILENRVKVCLRRRREAS